MTPVFDYKPWIYRLFYLISVIQFGHLPQIFFYLKWKKNIFKSKHLIANESDGKFL